MTKPNLKIIEAIDALIGEVSTEYSQAMYDAWHAGTRKLRALEVMQETSKVSMTKIRRYIRRRLKLKSPEHLEFLDRGFYVDYGKKPELIAPYVSCRIYCGSGLIIKMEFSPISQEHLDEKIDRMRRTVEAQRRMPERNNDERHD